MPDPTSPLHPDDDEATAAARALLNGKTMARWLAPTAESRIERISLRTIGDRDWPPDGNEPDDLAALRQSVAAHGIVEPLLLRPRPGGEFQLVTGSRRLRVARELGLATVPAIVRDLDDVATTVATLWSVAGRQRLSPEQTAAMHARLVAAGIRPGEATALIEASNPALTPFVVDAPRAAESRLAQALALRPRQPRFMTVAPAAEPDLPPAISTPLLTLLRDLDPATVLHPDA